MGKKLLIDATHAEETRVVVVDGNKVEEFDFETIHKRQLAGNIYLAKVTRVEPSLQAAFVDYGGNRHGFLAFAEIHPDYYQIPVADREALLAEERALAREQEDDNGNGGGHGNGNSGNGNGASADGNGNGGGNGKSSGRRTRRRRSSNSDDKAKSVSAEDNLDTNGETTAEAVPAGDAKPESGDAKAHDDTVKASEQVPVEQAAAEQTTAEPVAETVAEPVAETAAPAEAETVDAPAQDAATPEAADTAEPAAVDAQEDAPAEAAVATEDTPADPAVAEAPADAAPEETAEEAPVVEAEAADAPVEPTPEAAQTEADSAEPAQDESTANDTNPNPSGGAIAANAEGMDKVTYGAMDVVDLGEDEGESESNDNNDDADASSDAQAADNDETGNDTSGSDDSGNNDSGDHSDDEPEPYRAADFASENDSQIESVADEDVQDEVRPPRRPRARRYKIQEVIKVRQIMLVQVVKEERGNKGAALTTYLSLAGRYCVLMPNTARGGGISRKITNAADRKKLKEIAGEISVPEGAGLIIRTAGANRTKPEIRRDYEYLFRVWERVRELTLKSIAPAPIYEEGNLIKRSIRDLYNRDIDEVLVEGEAGYRTAKDFMKMIMPSHAKNVRPYRETMPLFARYQVESYLGSMFNPTVQLKSGGYIVIGVTEALVAIDVNSGKSTREGSIEDTALKTNLEAADEVARQLRLRDLAGLIVIDFIDMEERRNNASVEKRMKDALRTDRARIQVGRISAFGLMEMSRQRLRPGMLEATTQPCAHCHGTGLIRSDNSLALQILRALEEEGTRDRSKEVLVKAPTEVVNYLFNTKREHIAQIEARYGMAIRLEADTSLISPDYTIEKFKTATRIVTIAPSAVVSLDAKTMSDLDDELSDNAWDDEAESDANEASETSQESDDQATSRDDDSQSDNGDGGKRKRRRRRRRRGGNDQNGEQRGDGGSDNGSESGSDGQSKGQSDASTDGSDAGDASVTDGAEASPADTAEGESAKPARKRRSRSRKKSGDDEAASEASAEAASETVTEASPEATDAVSDAAEAPAPKKRTRARRPSKAAAEAASAEAPAPVAEAAVSEPATEAPVAEVASVEVPAAEAVATPEAEAPSEPAAEPATEAAPEATAQAEAPEETAEPMPAAESEIAAAKPAPEAPRKPRRVGWWSRKE
ncbi:Rne/Rng family ribonuclease [Pararhodobacter oceanensis]|uniref:Rne/Rng family ribonuclease n=1 Tax=Pararhodobacter oceanensis TaxID=2172121 RepID=UPI003A8D8C8E